MTHTFLTIICCDEEFLIAILKKFINLISSVRLTLTQNTCIYKVLDITRDVLNAL